MNILVIEHIPQVAKKIESFLNGLSYGATFRTSCEEGWREFNKFPDKFDLILINDANGGQEALKLLGQVRSQGYDVRVILTTNRLKMENVIEAARLGAFDILEMPLNFKQLRASFHNLVQLIEAEQRFLGHLSLIQSNTDLRIPSNLDVVPGIVSYLEALLRPFFIQHKTNFSSVYLALHEALINAIVHGNLEVDSKLKDQEDDAFDKLVKERSQQKPYCDRSVHIRYEINTTLLKIEVEDEGPGFNTLALPNLEDSESLISSGRGIVIIHSCMEHVSWNDKGNCLRMEKHFIPQSPTS